MRVVSHTCSNTEIVCALGCADMLVGIDTDSDYPPEVVAPLPKLGRDLDLDVEQVRTLKPDLVLTSLTVPGHERIVDGLRDHGLPLLVIDPLSLDDVYTSIIEIAEALGVLARGRTLVAQMQAQMPPAESSAGRPKILVEWWPKPVIVPARDSWVTDIIELAGGINPCAVQAMKSVQVSPDMAREMQPDAIVMSWCGVEEKTTAPTSYCAAKTGARFARYNGRMSLPSPRRFWAGPVRDLSRVIALFEESSRGQWPVIGFDLEA
ncbi:MAG: ABC transporter substrate-binding protein [Stenotrophobium sp.]